MISLGAPRQESYSWISSQLYGSPQPEACLWIPAAKHYVFRVRCKMLWFAPITSPMQNLKAVGLVWHDSWLRQKHWLQKFVCFSGREGGREKRWLTASMSATTRTRRVAARSRTARSSRTHWQPCTRWTNRSHQWAPRRKSTTSRTTPTAPCHRGWATDPCPCPLMKTSCSPRWVVWIQFELHIICTCTCHDRLSWKVFCFPNSSLATNLIIRLSFQCCISEIGTNSEMSSWPKKNAAKMMCVFLQSTLCYHQDRQSRSPLPPGASDPRFSATDETWFSVPAHREFDAQFNTTGRMLRGKRGLKVRLSQWWKQNMIQTRYMLLCRELLTLLRAQLFGKISLCPVMWHHVRETEGLSEILRYMLFVVGTSAGRTGRTQQAGARASTVLWVRPGESRVREAAPLQVRSHWPSEPCTKYREIFFSSNFAQCWETCQKSVGSAFFTGMSYFLVRCAHFNARLVNGQRYSQDVFIKHTENHVFVLTLCWWMNVITTGMMRKTPQPRGTPRSASSHLEIWRMKATKARRKETTQCKADHDWSRRRNEVFQLGQTGQ